MIRRCCASAVLVALLAPVHALASVDEAWLELQEVLSATSHVPPVELVDDLLNAAEEIELRRMTPYASALVAWSVAHPGAGNAMLEAAVRLDPELPAGYFLLSRRTWAAGDRMASATWFAKGCVATVRNEVTRRSLVQSLGIWLILGLAGAAATGIVVFTGRTIRRTIHDAVAAGSKLFESTNAAVFGCVLLLLPLLAGLGPIWLAVYLFVVGWVYLEQGQRNLALTICVFLALVPVMTEGWQRTLLRGAPLASRVAVMLDERQLDPSALREFMNLKERFHGDVAYHVILGELLRMHSAIESAKYEFQSATEEPLGDARPFVFLGNMALEDGNVALAIQYYDSAISTDGSTALAYHNLSSAYDLNRRFEQGDAARDRARELAGGRSASLGYRGRDPRIRYPKVSSDDVSEFVSGLAPEERLLLGLSSTRWQAFRKLASPISFVFWVGALVGLLLLAARSRWLPAAKECSKCGKVYRLGDEPGESPVYCLQCVSVFLQRDLVPIEQQTAKLNQVRRWERLTTVLRRVLSVVAPGGYQLTRERVGLGITLGLIAWLSVIGATVWVPRFLEVIEPTMPVQPAFVILGLGFLGALSVSVTASWQRR